MTEDDKDFFNSPEFRDTLASYEMSEKQNIPLYMDVDDFLDISDYYMSIQDMKASEKAIERGLSIHRGDPLLNISKAGIAIFKGDYDTARKIAEEQAGCGEQDLLFINGQLALTEMPPNMQKAEDLFRQWLEIEESESKGNKDDMKDAYARVINSIYEISGSIKVTERWIEEYIEKNSPLNGDSNDMELVDICKEASLYGTLASLYTKILDTNPYIKGGWSTLSTALLFTDKTDEAEEASEFALAIDPEDSMALLTKAQCMFVKTNYEEAYRYFKKYTDITKDKSHLLNMGICLVECGKYDEAVDIMESAKETYDSTIVDRELYAWACYEKANALLLKGETAGAVKEIDEACSIIDSEESFMQLKCEITTVSDSADEAIRVCMKAFGISGKFTKCIITAASRLMARELYEEASALLNNLLLYREFEPRCDEAYAYLALCMIKMDNTEKFLMYLKEACENCPNILKGIFGDMFKGIKPEEYYNYLISKNRQS